MDNKQIGRSQNMKNKITKKAEELGKLNADHMNKIELERHGKKPTKITQKWFSKTMDRIFGKKVEWKILKKTKNGILYKCIKSPYSKIEFNDIGFDKGNSGLEMLLLKNVGNQNKVKVKLTK